MLPHNNTVQMQHYKKSCTLCTMCTHCLCEFDTVQSIIFFNLWKNSLAILMLVENKFDEIENRAFMNQCVGAMS